MLTTEYRIRVDAVDGVGKTIASYEQVIAQDTLKKARPRLLITFIERMVRDFIRGHTAAEKKLAPKKRRPIKLGISTLLPRSLDR